MKDKINFYLTLPMVLVFTVFFLFLPHNVIAQTKPIELKFATTVAHAKDLLGANPWFEKEVEKRTEGRVKVNVYYGETLVKGREMFDALEKGLADIIFPAPHHQPGKAPLFTLGNVPGLTSNYWAKAMAWHELLETADPIKEEFSRLGGVVIGAAYYSPVMLITKSPITSLDQLKGLKIAAMYPSSELVKVFGAVPVSLVPGEQYEALMRGTVDGIAAPNTAILGFRFYEVGKHLTRFNLGDRQHAILISKKSLAKLSARDQKIITDMAWEYTKAAYDNACKGLEPAGLDLIEKQGVKIIQPSETDTKRLLEAADKLAEQWVNEMEGKGLPGKQLMARYKELIKKWEPRSPYRK